MFSENDETLSQIDECRLLTIAQVAAMLGVSPRTIKLWHARGQFPGPIRPGGHSIRWPIGVIREYVSRDCAGGWCHPDEKLL